MENSLYIKVDYKLLTDLIYALGGLYLFSFLQKLDHLIFDRNPESGLYFWASLGIVILSIHLTIYYFGRLVIYSKRGVNFFKFREDGSLKGIFFLLFTILVVSHMVYVDEINVSVIMIELFGIVLYGIELYQIHFTNKN